MIENQLYFEKIQYTFCKNSRTGAQEWVIGIITKTELKKVTADLFPVISQ